MIKNFIAQHTVAVVWMAIFAAILGLTLSLAGRKLRVFFAETWVELCKCSWPWDPQQSGLRKYKELIDSTMVVIISSLLLGGFVTFWDFILVKLVGVFTRLHG
jgi:preprotein translocase subunit SecE